MSFVICNRLRPGTTETWNDNDAGERRSLANAGLPDDPRYV